MDKAITTLSGGLDSAVSTAIAGRHHDVSLAITFDYGQRAVKKEIEAAEYFCKKWKIEHRVMKLDFLTQLGKSSLTHKENNLPHITIEELEEDRLATVASAEQVWVPNRNGIFLNIMAGLAEAENYQWIITGFNREEAETFPDNSPRYIELINSCLAQSTLAQPQVVSYVKDFDKTEILNEAQNLNLEIEKIWCCYDGSDKWCGNCESCARTIRAMEHLDVYDKYKDLFHVVANP